MYIKPLLIIATMAIGLIPFQPKAENKDPHTVIVQLQKPLCKETRKCIAGVLKSENADNLENYEPCFACNECRKALIIPAIYAMIKAAEMKDYAKDVAYPCVKKQLASLYETMKKAQEEENSGK